jgi:hypothetical protein
MARVHLDTSIFERTHTREEARRARKLENLYHAGQHKIWDGREVLAGLVAKHGGVHMKTAEKQALARVFSSLMWGELAAWKISAQLADRLDGYEARLAATSQAHDEARHFYVLHDYLELLELELPALDPATRYLLETVLGTDVLTEKLVGMQLFVETMALTMFKTVRELAVEPVLTELLSYFERDEARHVGLGIQHVPRPHRAHEQGRAGAPGRLRDARAPGLAGVAQADGALAAHHGSRSAEGLGRRHADAPRPGGEGARGQRRRGGVRPVHRGVAQLLRHAGADVPAR